MLTISSVSQGINSFQPKFSVTMTRLIEFDSSPMISLIESMHRDSTLRKPFWSWHSPFPQLHFDGRSQLSHAIIIIDCVGFLSLSTSPYVLAKCVV